MEGQPHQPSESEGASIHYILKATAVCGNQCNIISKEKLGEEEIKCLCKNL